LQLFHSIQIFRIENSKGNLCYPGDKYIYKILYLLLVLQMAISYFVLIQFVLFPCMCNMVLQHHVVFVQSVRWFHFSLDVYFFSSIYTQYISYLKWFWEINLHRFALFLYSVHDYIFFSFVNLCYCFYAFFVRCSNFCFLLLQWFSCFRFMKLALFQLG
jgi:hypothetical protein